MAGGKVDSEVVEELTFEIAVDVFDRWLAREGAAWDAFLRSQDGFVHKEVWLAPDGENDGSNGRRTVRVMIWWASHAQWKAVDPAGVEAADGRMGDLLFHSECREYRVLRRV